jgi:hypothetical protein
MLALVVVAGLWNASRSADEAPSVRQTVLTYIKAAAEGDFEILDQMSTGPARNYNAHPGTARFEFHQAFARTFIGLGSVKIKKDLAAVLVRFDPRDLTRLLRRAARARLKKMHPDPQTRRRMETHIRNWAPIQARRMSRLRVWLVKKDGRWLIHRISPAARRR